MPVVESLFVALGKSFLNTVSPTIKEKFEKFTQVFSWHTAQIRYYAKIEKDYSTTRILGKHEPIPIEGIFTDVYLLDKPTAYNRFDLLQLQSEPGFINLKQKLVSGLDLVKKSESRRLYILGKPGAGKTTFLRYIALKASQSEIRKIPIFVSLKEWADSGDMLMEFLVKQFDICQFPDSQPLIEYILEQGLAIVLFDGLDETQKEGNKRDQIINDIRNFSRKYDESQILVTCRIAATDFTFEEFTYLEVSDFTEKQVKSYIKKYFSNRETVKKFEEEFSQNDNKGLREMANTPLLLSLLCLNFEETGTLPQRRVEIYEEGIRALLHKWDASRNVKRDDIYKGLSLGRKQQMFSRIAAQTFEKNEYFLSKKQLSGMIVNYLIQLPNPSLEEDINAEAVLKAIEEQHSIIVERAQNIYSFSHLAFQEYFTAKYVVENAASESLAALLSPKNIVDDRWREVILNTASLLDNADSFFKNFQQSANSIIANDIALTNFLNWVDIKAKSVGSNVKIPLAKGFYCYLELTHELDFSNALKFAFTLDNTQDIYITRALPSAYKSDYNIEFVQSFARTLSRKYNLNIELAFDLKLIFLGHLLTKIKQENNSQHSILFILIEIWREIKFDVRKIEDKRVEVAIDRILIPSKNSTLEDLEIFAEDLKQLMQSHRNIGHNWKFSKTQIEALSTYFSANTLIVNCLKLAVVPNRETIENNLLLLPK